MTEHELPQQLTLVPAPEVPPRFLLDAGTRERGTRHIAAIRAQLAARRSTPDEPGLVGRSGQRPAA